MKRTDLNVTFAGSPIDILGAKVSVGDVAPDFEVLNAKLQPVKLSDYAGNKVVIAVYPSVDTSVCAAQNRRFNAEADKMDDVVVLSISCDLPFAQARFCAAEGLNSIITLSDHRTLDFGMKYGFVMEPLRLLARGTIIVDAQGVVQYVEHCSEVTDEPDYDKAMDVLKSL